MTPLARISFPLRLRILTRSLTATCVLLFFSANVSSQPTLPTLLIDSYDLLSQTQVTPETTESTFSVRIRNKGPVAENIRAFLIAGGDELDITPSTLTWYAVGQGQRVASNETLTIRHGTQQVLTSALLRKALKWFIEFDSEPVLLGGRPAESALTAMRSFYNGNAVSPSEISYDPHIDNDIARTVLQLTVRPTTTVEALNQLLLSIGGGITCMHTGYPNIVIRIPDPLTVEALYNTIAKIFSTNLVDDVFPATFPVAEALPQNPFYHPATGFPAGLDPIAHHLAVGAHAIWNAQPPSSQNLTSTSPRIVLPHLIVRDFFGQGPPNLELFGFFKPIELIPAEPRLWQWAKNKGGEHGYHVLSIVAARGSTNNDLRGKIVGLASNPQLHLHAIDSLDWKCNTSPDCLFYRTAAEGDERERKLLEDLLGAKGFKSPIVINHSFGSHRSCPNGKPDLLARNESEAKRFANFMRFTEEKRRRILFVQAAGNDPNCEARYMGYWQRAFTGIPFEDGTPALSNGLIIENFPRYSEVPNRRFYPTPDTVSSRSSTSGHVGGVGTAVWGLIDPAGRTRNLSGTSMAAPQVAALATSLWRFDPQLTSKEIIARIKCNAIDPARMDPTIGVPAPMVGTSACDPASQVGGVIDGYATLLTVDKLKQPYSWGKAPVREAVLDVANERDELMPDKRFDEHDIKAFLNAFRSAESRQPNPPESSRVDYSRYDLNGDGITGGQQRAFFDLDNSSVSGIKLEETKIKIEDVDVPFDEAKGLTDLHILIYYAYSDVFSSAYDDGGLTRRLLFLDQFPKIQLLSLASVTIDWNKDFLSTTPSTWTTPPTITLTGFSNPTRAWFGNNGGCETGGPVFSTQPFYAGANFIGVLSTQGVPYQNVPILSIRRNYSSFVAVLGGLAWISASMRGEKFADGITYDWEYQTRLYLGEVGDLNARTKSQVLAIGIVPNSGNFSGLFSGIKGDNFRVSFRLSRYLNPPTWSDCRSP